MHSITGVLRRRAKLTQTVLLTCAVLVLTACDSGSSDDPGDNTSQQGNTDGNTVDNNNTEVGNQTPSQSGTGFSQTLANAGTVQDVWTIEGLRVIDQDGQSRDISDLVLTTYADALSEPVDISPQATFSQIDALAPKIIAESGIARSHIDVIAGQLSFQDRNYLLVIATPDVDRGGLVTHTDRIQLDLTRLEDQIGANLPLSADYFFAVTTPGDDPDLASGGLELMLERLQAGRFTLQSESPEPDSAPLLVTGNIGTTIAGSLLTGLPPKSLPLLCGLPSPPSGGCGVFCLADNLNNIYQGFESSFTAFDSNFGPGTGVSPSSSTCGCLAGNVCSSGGNDPHLKTFDGVALSPQSIGEFDAIEYQGVNQTIRTQFRFTAVPGNRTVSYITVAALGIDDTRITVAPNRDSVVELNGEPISFSDLGAPQLNGSPLDNTGNVQIIRSNRGVQIASGGWIWNFSFSGRTADGTKFINFLINAPGDATGIQGLLGNANRDGRDDLRSRDSAFIIAPGTTPSVQEFYQQFVDTWRIEENSLFDYAQGESTTTYTDLTFPDFPNLVNGLDTPLSVAIVNPAVDTSQAEAVCTEAGISSDPSFTECVVDLTNTGDFDIANMSQLSFALDAEVKRRRFDDSIDGTNLRWWHVRDGNTTTREGDVVVTESLTLVTTAVPNGATTLNAFDTGTGQPYWTFGDTTSACEPVAYSTDRIVVQTGTNNELVLLDGMTGEELSRLGIDGDEFRVCSDALQITSNGKIILASRFFRYGISVDNDTLVLDWTFLYDEDPITSSASPQGRDVVLNDDLFYTARRDGVIVVFRIDTDTGVAVAEYSTDLSSDTAIQVGGEDLLIVSGSRGQVPAAFGLNADPNANNLTERWSREFVDTVSDRIDTGFGKIAVGANGFASWSSQVQEDGDSPSGIAEFDPQTGLANWFAETSSFDNNGQIVALPTGGFAVSPFGSDNFVETYDASGNFAWSIPYPTGASFPHGMAMTGDNTMVVVSRNGNDGSRTAIVNLGTLRTTNNN